MVDRDEPTPRSGEHPTPGDAGSILLVVLSRLNAIDARLAVVEESGIWKAVHDGNNALVSLAESYQRMLELTDEALRAVKAERDNASRIQELESEIRILKKSCPPPAATLE